MKTLAFAPCLLLAFVGATLGQGPFREAPRELAELSSLRVGELIPDFPFNNVDGEASRLSEVSGENGLVIAVRSVLCPVSRRYGTTLARLEEAYGFKGIRFLFLNVSGQDSVASIRKEIESFGFQGDYVFDASDAAIARALHVTTTTEVFLLDRARTLRYRGAIDDQYGIGYSKQIATTRYLEHAIDDVLAGRSPRIEGTSAPGCVLGLTPGETAAPETTTYHNRVSRILQRNCEGCHRDGGAGPFPLETFEQAKGFGSMISYVVENEVMPPWFADDAVGTWANDRSLPERDRNAVVRWAATGFPEGDPGDAPLVRKYTDGWGIGHPDAVFEIPESMEVPAEGVVDYQYVYVKTDLPEDRWVQKMEILPTAPQVTHHVLAFIEEPGRKSFDDETRRPDEPFRQGGLSGYFASTVPGQQPTIFPEGAAKLLPKGAWLKFQIHYTPNGEPAVDRTRIGFVFADTPPRHVVETSSAAQTTFEIPPGASSHEVSGSHELEKDIMLTGFFPHMHLRGKAFRYDLVYPDGREEILLDIPRYDFNWQLLYELDEPKWVPRGTVIRSTGWFDNSPDNPANPDPTIPVTWGDQSFDEMLIGYFDWYDPTTPPGTTAP